MADLVIKKKLELDYLGEEYKDSYLVFKSVPVKDYTDLMKKISDVEEGDNNAATLVMLDLLKQYFVDGVFQNSKVLKDDLDQLDGETVVKCFQTLTGQFPDGEGGITIDPKDESSSTSQSKTEPENPPS